MKTMLRLSKPIFSCAIFILSLLIGNVVAEPLKKMTVTVDAAGIDRNNAIVSLDLSKFDLKKEEGILVKSLPDETVCISQLEISGDKAMLYWRIEGNMPRDQNRDFRIEIKKSEEEKASPALMKVSKESNGDLTLSRNGKNILKYAYAMPRLPHGTDPVFRRNGFIHPVWSPAGNILTAINPPDHAHHYGIWSAWTAVEYDKKRYDLWNIGDKTGTVHAESVPSIEEGSLFAGILTHHLHIIFQPQAEQVINTTSSTVRITPKKRVVIMDEALSIKAWNTGSDNTFLWDFTSELTPATTLPVLFKAYRYAGFVWRATSDWHKGNSVMMTSEGKSRSEIDGTNAKWIYAEGESAKGKSGILFMSSPQNHSFPEPLRIWDQKANAGRGDAFINFAPAKNKDWLLEPHKTYTLKYRMLVYDGEMSPNRAESIWNDFANPVKVKIH